MGEQHRLARAGRVDAVELAGERWMVGLTSRGVAAVPVDAPGWSGRPMLLAPGPVVAGRGPGRPGGGRASRRDDPDLTLRIADAGAAHGTDAADARAMGRSTSPIAAVPSPARTSGVGQLLASGAAPRRSTNA